MWGVGFGVLVFQVYGSGFSFQCREFWRESCKRTCSSAFVVFTGSGW